jgi:hypothetical protein
LLDTKGNRISEDMPISLREEFSEYVSFKVKLKDSNSSVLYQRVQLMLGKLRQKQLLFNIAILTNTNKIVLIAYDNLTPKFLN